MRIATLFPLYTIYSLLSICFPNAYVYLVGWTKLFQGIALYWFLMLLCDFVVPKDRHRAEFFASLKIPKRYSTSKTTDGLSSLKVSILTYMVAGYLADFLRLQSTWFFVLQYPIVAFILAIAQSITQALGIYCLEGNSAKFAHIWVSTFIVILTVDLCLTS